MEYLRWLRRLLKAVEGRYEEVMNDNNLSADKKGTMLSNLGSSRRRLRDADNRARVAGLTAELKNEILQAVIEGDVGELFGN